MIGKFRKIISAINAIIKVMAFKLKRHNSSVMFFCSSYIDEVWIRSTLKKCMEKNLQTILIIISSDKAILDVLKSEYGETLQVLILDRGDAVKFIKTKLVVTASSGLSKNYFYSSSKLIHMPHSLSSLHAIYPMDSFSGYDYLFSVGQYQNNEFKKLNGNKVYNVGYGKFDLIKEKKWLKTNIQTILLAPSWHEGNFFDLIGQELISYLLESKYKVILRPHPSHFIKPNTQIESVSKLYKDNSNFTLEDSTKGFDSFYKADLLVSDFSGVAFEFAYSRLHPVLFIESKYKVLNPQWNKLKIDPFEVFARKECGVISEVDIESIKNALKKLKPSEEWKDSIINSRSKNIYNFLECADNAYKIINDLLD